MKVEIVQLENIRSHVKSTVPFTHGFNCLVGGLGCGKSSVLYAVDFALFGGSIGRSFEYLLREDANAGKVTVVFTQSGKTYKITRGIKRRGKSISQDPDELKLFEDDALVASMKNEAIAEQIKNVTGLDKDLFSQIVWFRQEHLKELLDAQPRDRQKRLDELFGLSDYEAAWSNILQYQRDYETERRIFEKDADVIGLEKLGQEYNRSSEEFTLLEMDLEDAAQKVAISKHVLAEAESRLGLLEEKKLAVEELKRREAQLSANLSNAHSTLASLKQRYADKKTLIDGMLKRQSTFELQIKQCLTKLGQAGLPIDQPLEALSMGLAGFDEKISTLRTEQEAISRSLQQDQKRATALAETDESKCPVCSQPLSGNYKTDLLASIQNENVEREKTISHLRLELATLQKTKTVASEAYRDLQTHSARNADLKANIAEEENNLKTINVEVEAQLRFEADLRLELEALQFKISQFDLSELQVAKEKKDHALKQLFSVESDLRVKETRKKDLANRIDDIKDRINVAQQKLERVEKIRRTLETLGAIRDAYRSIQPKLRSEFVKVLRNFVQQVLDGLVGAETPFLNVAIDETYTPYVKSESGVDREVSNLSGGERTLLAFAYRLGLGQLIMQSRTGHGLSMLLLDEPTENLGSEDGSIERLAEAISRFKAIEQIIAVTHSEAFASKADHVITLEKEAQTSKVSIQR